jgi:hypothetical protein
LYPHEERLWVLYVPNGVEYALNATEWEYQVEVDEGKFVDESPSLPHPCMRAMASPAKR